MLSIFPDLLVFGLLSPFILRVAVSLMGIKYGVVRFNKKFKWLSVLHILTSLFILIGLYTQVAVLVGIALVKAEYWINKKTDNEKPKMDFYALIIVILLSLLFTGPGFLAFDLPL